MWILFGPESVTIESSLPNATPYPPTVVTLREVGPCAHLGLHERRTYVNYDTLNVISSGSVVKSMFGSPIRLKFGINV
jgi:hypothetical protein